MPHASSPYRTCFALDRSVGIVGLMVAIVCLCGGCLVPASRIETCQTRYHQVSEKNKRLQTEVANLQAECRKLQNERDQSEQELVVLDREVPAMLARQQNIARPPKATEQQLEALASVTAGLQFDSNSGRLQLTPSTFFRAGSQLKIESGDSLGALAALFTEPEVQTHRVLIVSNGLAMSEPSISQQQFQRVVTLRDFFCQWGIEKNRIGISNYGLGSKVLDGGQQKAPQVASGEPVMEIYLLADDVPVIGWNAPQQTVYR